MNRIKVSIRHFHMLDRYEVTRRPQTGLLLGDVIWTMCNDLEIPWQDPQAIRSFTYQRWLTTADLKSKLF